MPSFNHISSYDKFINFYNNYFKNHINSNV